MLKVLNDMNDCTGCFACFDICPTDAIDMIENDEYFLESKINVDKCIDCNKCVNTCPVYSYEKSKNSIINCYAVYSDDDIRKSSSSGGAFLQFAKYIIENNGYVSGVIFKENFLGAEHIITNKISEVYKMMGSKYIQSNMDGIYKKIKKILNNGHKVLFTGVPCQVAALNKFLGKNYDNLFSIDIMCQGVPSEYLWNRYLKENNIDVNLLKNVNFRSKVNGWNYNLILEFEFLNGKKKYSNSSCDEYYKAFLSYISLRQSCFSCKFTNINRESDITIGDFWECNSLGKNIDDGKGLSFLTTNTANGEYFFDKIKRERDSFVYIKSNVSLDDIKLGNHGFFKSVDKPKGRDVFYNSLKECSIKKSLYVASSYKYKCAIFNYWWSNNYGATLTAFALQKKLDELGYSSVLIHHSTSKNYRELEDCFYGGFSYKFAKKYLSFSKPYLNKDELKNLNNDVDIFITGSDQVWRDSFGGPSQYPMFYLKYVKYDKKKIAVSASFGTDKFEGTHNFLETKMLLSRFDYISVREKSGVDICKENFDISAEHIIDPVFMIDKSYYVDIAEKYKRDKKSSFVLSYIFPENRNEIFDNVLEYLEYDEYIDADTEKDIEYFLWCFYNADFIITDSFHGVCFSIIFNKPFICINNSLRGNERFISLFHSLDINLDVMIYDIYDIKSALNSANNLDYTSINKHIFQLQQHGVQWLRNALENENTQSLRKQISMLEEQNKIMNRQILAIYNFLAFSRLKYYRYKILSKLTFGSLRKKYKNKCVDYKLKTSIKL